MQTGTNAHSAPIGINYQELSCSAYRPSLVEPTSEKWEVMARYPDKVQYQIEEISHKSQANVNLANFWLDFYIEWKYEEAL